MVWGRDSDAEGCAFESVIGPFAGGEHGGELAVVDDVDEGEEDLGEVGEEDVWDYGFVARGEVDVDEVVWGLVLVLCYWR